MKKKKTAVELFEALLFFFLLRSILRPSAKGMESVSAVLPELSVPIKNEKNPDCRMADPKMDKSDRLFAVKMPFF